MSLKSTSYFLGLFCFPVSILAFMNILYSSYFDYFLSIDSYFATLIISLFTGFGLVYYGKNSSKKINFINQLILIIYIYILIGFFFAIPFYLSNNQVTFLNSFFSPSGLFFFSFNLALLTDARLLSLPSKASSSKALDIVSLFSLFELKSLSFPKLLFFCDLSWMGDAVNAFFLGVFLF